MKLFVFSSAFLFISVLQLIAAEVEEDCEDRMKNAENKAEELNEAGDLPKCCSEMRAEMKDKTPSEIKEKFEKMSDDERNEAVECMMNCSKVVTENMDNPPSDECVMSLFKKNTE